MVPEHILTERIVQKWTKLIRKDLLRYNELTRETVVASWKIQTPQAAQGGFLTCVITLNKRNSLVNAKNDLNIQQYLLHAYFAYITRKDIGKLITTNFCMPNIFF